jgi:hypothetical protein
VGAALAAGCGGQTLQARDDAGGVGDAGGATATIGPVDLTQAPTEIMMDCDHGVGQVAFVNPCLVGQNLAGSQRGIGLHETECQLLGGNGAIAWAFLLPLSTIAMSPDQPLTFSTNLPAPPTGRPAEIGGVQAGVSHVDGTMTFSRVDPSGRAFIGHFTGTITWTGSSGAFSCAVDAPFWGAPGNFL